MDPSTIMAVIQVVKFGVETIELAQSGQITPEQMQARLAVMRTRLAAADAAWVAAGKAE